MIDETDQHDMAKAVLQQALLRASIPFGPAMFTERQAAEAVQAIEWMIETRMALRELEIIEALRRMIEEQDERSRPQLTGAEHGVLPAGDVPEAGGLDDGPEGQGAADR